jgi:hypothetical protein
VDSRKLGLQARGGLVATAKLPRIRFQRRNIVLEGARTLDSAAPQRGEITKSVGGTRVAQLVFTALRTSKKSRTIACAHALAAGEGLPNATCPRLGISTTVEFRSVRATRGPNEGAVCASYCDEMTSVGMLLVVTSRIVRSIGGTSQTSQLERMN